MYFGWGIMKKLLSVVLCVLMLAALLPLGLHTAIADTSGQCGNNLYWSFDEDTGTLTITGSGDMYDYGQGSNDRAPWYTYYGQITTVDLPSGMTRIGDNAFYNCVMLRTVTIPEGVTAIGAYAFQYCPLKENFPIPESVTTIGEHAFDATGIWYVTVPADVTSIGEGAFSNCINLKEISVNAGNANYTAVGGVLFNRNVTELIAYPAGLQQSSYTVPSGVRTICAYACGCASFTTFTFADSVTEICAWAFFGCNNLKNVAIGNGVTTIGINAFRSCTSLETVFISRSVTEIHTSAFPACPKFIAFTVDADSQRFSAVDGVLLSKDGTALVLYPTGKQGHYDVPDGVACIKEKSFYWSSGLTSIRLPRSVTVVENNVFGQCNKLTDVYYGGTAADRQNLLTIGTSNGYLTNAQWHYQTFEITTQPKNKTVAVGKSVKFTVAASAEDVTYQWEYSKNNGASWTKWSGKTSAALSVKGSETNNGCLYRCMVTKDGESVTSDAARLTVSGVKPNILTQPKAATVAVGKSVTFKVAAWGVGLTYQWQYSKNNGASWTNWSGKTNASLKVTASATNNGCLYRCVVKNSYGSVTSANARLTVSDVKPAILTQPSSTTIAVGHSGTIKVVAAGSGLTYQWQYSKNNGASWTNWSGKTSASLKITASATNNGCLYRCVVKNTKGSVTTAQARLTVSGAKPNILTQPANQTVAAGGMATFKVTAWGENLTYQWQWSKDGKTWKNCTSNGYNTATFSFRSAASLSGRQYRCVVKNAAGSVNSTAALFKIK